MPDSISDKPWISIDHLQSRYQANLVALALRYPQSAQLLREFVPTANYSIQAVGDVVTLGRHIGGVDGAVIQPLPVILSPATAVATINTMFPDGKYKVALIAGEDLGWLWNRLYQLPCTAPNVPGYRPPMFFLMRDLERLRIILHLQDWRELLADSRVRLFIGEQCVQQFEKSLLSDEKCPWPALWVTVTPDIWPPAMDAQTILAAARIKVDQELAALHQAMKDRAAATTPAEIASRFTTGRPLRVLGVTSLFTSFLQHSMRDWLDAFDRLGHVTQLEIEHAAHEMSSNFVLARSCARFKPDLIVSIDHHRKTLSGVPDDVPVVMWIQDALPALFSAEAGAAQGTLDFSISLDPLKMTHDFGYPADRMMSALIGVNDKRFNINRPALADPDFACDVSFVSHASTPAEVLLDKYLKQLDSEFATRFWHDLFARLKQVYSSGSMITAPIALRQMIDQSIKETRVTVSPDQMQMVEFVFGNQINNALFRHQSLQWLADAGVDLHLYGNGWEQHPTLAPCARGPADNKTALAAIYRSSKINLHISPHGAVHQRVMEGLASGGFFMLRYCAGDRTERLFQTLWQFCLEKQIATDDQLQAQATPRIAAVLSQVEQILHESPFGGAISFIDSLRNSAANGFVRSAASIWGDDYDAVAYNSQAELITKVSHFLQSPVDRLRRAESMRKIVLERFTYVEMTRRLVGFVQAHLHRQASINPSSSVRDNR